MLAHVPTERVTLALILFKPTTDASNDGAKANVGNPRDPVCFLCHPELGSGSNRIGQFETLKQVQGDKKD